MGRCAALRHAGVAASTYIGTLQGVMVATDSLGSEFTRSRGTYLTYHSSARHARQVSIRRAAGQAATGYRTFQLTTGGSSYWSLTVIGIRA